MTLRERILSLVRWLSQGKRMPVALGLVFTLTLAWTLTNPLPLVVQTFARLDLLLYDLRLWSSPRPERNPEHRIVIVDLDERSLQAEGQYPWNRFKVGRLVNKLRENGTLLVGFDITFPEPDRTVRDILEASGQGAPAGSEVERLLALTEETTDSDRFFASAMSATRVLPGSQREVPAIEVILSINFNRLRTVTYNQLPASIVSVDESIAPLLTLNDMSGFTGNIPLLQEAAAGIGNMSQLPDIDGVVRRVPLILRYGEELYPTLALEMFRVFRLAGSYQLLTDSVDEREVVRAVQVGQGYGAFVIPTDQEGSVLVPYFGRGSQLGEGYFDYVSATDVLNDGVDPELFRNSLVLIGTSAPGLQDVRPTPLDQSYPGVEVHATLLHALLDSEPFAELGAGAAPASTQSIPELMRNLENVKIPFRPGWELGLRLLSVLFLGTLLAFLLPHLGAVAMLAVASGVLSLMIGMNYWLWISLRLDFSLVTPLVLVLMLTAINISYGFLVESRSRRMIKGMFDQYVPPAHIDAMLREPERYSLEGESKEMTVLFSDIRGFTALSEALDATQLKALLNEFFTPITDVIFAHNGTVDKYVGDMVMAFWGAPLADKAHRRNAINAALALAQEVKRLKKVFAARGLPEIDVGIGVNSGLMNVGDMGSEQRRAYTVLGDAVNLGSRLEGLTKLYGVQCLLGEETAHGLDDLLLRRIDKVRVRGKHQAVQCFEPLGYLADADASLKERVAAFHTALAYYEGQEWDHAEQVLRQLLQEEPDSRLYQLYLQRIADLRGRSLPAQWDGVYAEQGRA